MYTIIIAYVLSMMTVAAFLIFTKEKAKKPFGLTWSWHYIIMCPVINTILSVIILLSLITSIYVVYIEPNWFSTWQILPNIQFRKETDSELFIVISFPIYGTLVYRFERKVKETDDSHHAE